MWGQEYLELSVHLHNFSGNIKLLKNKVYLKRERNQTINGYLEESSNWQTVSVKGGIVHSSKTIRSLSRLYRYTVVVQKWPWAICK